MEARKQEDGYLGYALGILKEWQPIGHHEEVTLVDLRSKLVRSPQVTEYSSEWAFGQIEVGPHCNCLTELQYPAEDVT